VRLSYCHFAREKIECDISITLRFPQIAAELMQHQSRSNVGRVDRTPGRATTRLCVRLIEQSRGVMITAEVVSGGQNSDHFSQPPAVTPEVSGATGCSPNRGPRRNRIDAAEHRFASHVTWTEAIDDCHDFDCRIDFRNRVFCGLDFGESDFLMATALRRHIGQFNRIKINQLQRPNPECRELESNLPTNRPNTDHRDCQ
jgi:hypothetical protein